MSERWRQEKNRAPSAESPAEFDDLPPRWQERLLRLAPVLLELGMASVVSAEEARRAPDGDGADCRSRIAACRSVCCSFRFALTREEVSGGKIAWDRERPYFISRGPDGFCAHLDRDTRRCLIYRDRPLRCRSYDCRRESSIWEDGECSAVKPGAFDHLP